jgi:cyclopropane fatty-acyl-phospholipid synthase-like methyltransferase
MNPSPNDDAELVRAGYDRAAERYAAQRDRFQNERHLELFTEILTPPATVLDLGCGSGVPIDSYLVAHGYDVVGLDISPKQIKLAKQSVPEAHYEVRNMLDLGPDEYNVDGLISFYAIFHTPRTRHAELIKNLASYLKPGGVVLISMGAEDYEGTEGEFHGAEMYWSHFGPAENRRLVEAAEFKVRLDEIDTSSNERHQIILAIRE